jgi:hypothetical protein
VKKVSEYEEHVRECKELARLATSPEHRKMLLNMAESWQALADERRRQTKGVESEP